MLCATVKNGTECAFMKSGGCAYIGGACKPIAEQCQGCDRVVKLEEAVYCQPFPDPAARWRLGNCSMATHIKVDTKGSDKVRVGQQKQKRK